jgi:hypothetical protein
LHTFDLLPDGDKRELASDILRRTLMLDVPPLSDEQLVGAAEDIFLQLDQSEADRALAKPVADGVVRPAVDG